MRTLAKELQSRTENNVEGWGICLVKISDSCVKIIWYVFVRVYFDLTRPKDINKINVLEMTTNKNNQISEPIIKMNTKTVNELRSIAKD